MGGLWWDEVDMVVLVIFFAGYFSKVEFFGQAGGITARHKPLPL